MPFNNPHKCSIIYACVSKLELHCYNSITTGSREASPTFGHVNEIFSVFIDRMTNQFLKK